MKLTILGSGAMMPTVWRHPSAYLVEAAGVRLLLDCGHTTVARLIEKDVDLHSIDAIAVTHFHTDHFADVLPLIHARFVDDRMNKVPHKKLVILGPKTLQDRFKALRAVTWPEPSEDYPIEFKELEGGDSPVVIGSLSITPFLVKHVPWFPSIGYRLSEGGPALVYPGDLGKDQEEAFYAQLKGLDTLLIEAATLEPRPNHFSPQQALELKKEYGIRRVLVTHVCKQRLEGVQTFMRENEGLVLTEDGMTVEI